MVYPEPVAARSIKHAWLLALIAICCTSVSLYGDEQSDEPELLPGRTIARCQVTERPATAKDVRLSDRIPVLVEPVNWRDVPGPHGERAVFWQETGTRHGYRILDRRGHELHKLEHLSMPRWSPDGRWLAVSHWTRRMPYQLALIEVTTGKVIPIPQVEYLGECAWSPDSRRLAFVAQSYTGVDSSSVGWIAVPDTSAHVVVRGFNTAFECEELAWSADSRRFVALMHREYEHDDVRVTDLWLFGLAPGVCRLTATPGVEEWNVGWLDDRRVIFLPQRWDDDEALSGFGTVLELPALAKSPR
jgi:Tol biopolymer transport system component